jgi:hypothetical protein
MMKALKPYGITYSTLHSYASLFTWPRRIGNMTGVNALGPKRAKGSWDAKRFKAQASELQSLFPVLANFMTNVVCVEGGNAVARRHGLCFLKLTAVLDLIDKSARGGVTKDALQRAMATYLTEFKALYGEAVMTIKFHLAFHLAVWLDSVHFLPNCTVLERKHRTPKKFADAIRNTGAAFESGVLREVTLRHLGVLCDACSVHFEVQPCLQNPITPNAKLKARLESTFGSSSYIASAAARCSEWEVVHTGDVVLFTLRDGNVGVGRVQLHFSTSKRYAPLTIIHQWEFIRHKNDISYTWRAHTDWPCVVDTSVILCATTFCLNDGVAEVLRPAHARV